MRPGCLLILLIFSFPGLAQHYYTHTYTINDGLPSNQVNCLYQDNIGRLWIGTDAGIGIFDGLNFSLIDRRDGLASNDIRAIIQDEKGVFWFACYDGGITRYDGERFTSYSTKTGLHSNFIRRLYYSRTYQTLFIGANDGFYTFHNEKFVFYGKANGKLDEEHEVLGFLEARGFVYILSFHYYRMKFYPQTGVVEPIIEDMSDMLPEIGITSAMVTKAGDTVWGNRFRITTRENRTLRLNPPRRGLVMALCEDQKGNVWFPLFGVFTSGVLRYNGAAMEDMTDLLGLKDIMTNYVLYDKNSGILWLSTEKKGLIKVTESFITQYPLSGILKGRHEFRKLYYHKNVLYLVYKDFLVKRFPDGREENFQINMAANRFRLVRHTEQNNPAAVPYIRKGIPEFNEITADRDGTLWASTTGGFFMLPDQAGESPVSLTKYAGIFEGFIAFDQGNDLYNWGYWTDTLQVIRQPGISRNPGIETYTRRHYNLPKEITGMAPYRGGMLFSSLWGGLYFFNGKSFSNLNKTCRSLPGNISNMCLDPDGSIIYCTNTGEIGAGTLKGGHFVHHFRLDSLNNAFGRNFIWLISNKTGSLFVGTNKGMLILGLSSLFTGGKKDIRFFSLSEGYFDYSVNFPVMDDLGNLWLASQENLIKIDSRGISKQKVVKQEVFLNKIEASGSIYAIADKPPDSMMADRKKEWQFPFHERHLIFYFSSNNMFNPDKDQFSAWLEGFDGSFRDLGSDRKAVYTNLPVGTYRFKVRITNLNSQQSETKTLFEFSILPPFWQTWWFIAICILIILMIVAAIYFRRVRVIRRKTRLKLEMAELEMQSLQAQMNPHFVFNVLNSLQRYILERDTKKGIRLLSDFSSMIRQTFTLASKKMVTLQEEIIYLESYLKLEQERFAYRFHFEITTDESIQPALIHIPCMLIQPMIENAVKHGLSPLEGRVGMVTVSFISMDKETLKCVITDNGIGMERSLAMKKETTERLSRALGITQRRIALFRQFYKEPRYEVTIRNRSEFNSDETGVIVEIILPVRKDEPGTY